MRPPFLGTTALLGEVRLRAMRVAVDAMVLQRVSGVEHPLNRLHTMPLFAFLDIVACEAQVIENPVRIGPLPKEIIVLEEMIVPERGMRNYQSLHRHGILFHDIADTRVRVDDDLVGKALQAPAVEGFVIRKPLAEAPM